MCVLRLLVVAMVAVSLAQAFLDFDEATCSSLVLSNATCTDGDRLADVGTLTSCKNYICSNLLGPYAEAHGSDLTRRILGSGYGCIIHDWDGHGVENVICMSTPMSPEENNTAPASPEDTVPQDNITTPQMEAPQENITTPMYMPTPKMQAPQDNITVPVDMPAPQENITTPMYMPTPKMEAPVATPQDTTTPVDMPSPQENITTPIENITAPVDMPAPQEFTTPVYMPTPKMETPVDMPAPHDATPMYMPTPKMQAPVDMPVPQDNSSSPVMPPVMPTPEECLNLTAVNASSEDACPSGTELADEKSMKDCSAHICGELIGKNEVARGKDFTITGSADGCKVAPWDGKTKTDEQICMPKGGGGGGGNHTVLIVLLVIGGVLLVGAIIWYIRHRRAQAIGTGYSAEMLNAGNERY